MEVEKKRSKGGFLNLFDWNGKSRKKLFTNNSELPEESQLGKENVDNRAKSRLQMVETDESRASSSNKESSDYNCASSVTSDEGYVTRAPGVVARLMGLDSMPTSNVSEPCSTPYFDLCSHRASHLNRSNPNLWTEYQPTDSLNFTNKLEKLPWNSVESRPSKVLNRPIERFQTEVLPPRSAKPIPITHHKLLSPIKSPGFFPSRNATYIIEAAAKIIEASPQPTTKSKTPSIVSSPVPLRIRDLKERMEAAHKASRSQRSNEPCLVKNMKGQWSDKNLSKSESKSAFKASTSTEKSSPESLRNKGKSVSVAVQAKVNVQRREGSTSSSSTSSKKQKVKNDVKVNPLHKGQPDVQRNVQKGTSPNRTNNVLRQNNQKQNHIPNKDSSISGSSISNQQCKKAKPVNGSTEPTRSVKKVVVHSETGSRKNDLVTTDTEKKLSSSRRKDVTQNKLHMERNLQFGESITNNMFKRKDKKFIKANVAADGPVNWDADGRKKGMDIVSFTFTSPIKRSVPDPQPSNHIMGKVKSFSLDSHGDVDQSYSTNSTFRSPGFGVIGSDTLNVLLEQKLRELTCKIESSHCNIVREGTSTSFAAALQDLVSISPTSAEDNKRSQFGVDKDKSESLREFDCSSIDNPGLVVNPKWQHSEGLEEHSISSNNSETGIEFDCRHPSPVSILEPSFMTGSCSDVKKSSHGKKQYLAEAQVCGWFPTNTNDSTTGECETELSDSASSISFGSKHTTKMSGLIDSEESSNWEFNNVKMIIVNAELMLEEFALGQTNKVMTPNLFDHLENHENGDEVSEEEKSKLGRKLLFDCVSECVESKCRQFYVGSHKAWAKCGTLFQWKAWLAEEVYRKIVGWRSMGDLMVDELVNKDMSSQCGRWVDFDLEAFEEGEDIENGILTSLVDELVSDLI